MASISQAVMLQQCYNQVASTVVPKPNIPGSVIESDIGMGHNVSIAHCDR